MHALDAVFWTCLLLGGGYTAITLVLGGLGHSGGDAGSVDAGAVDAGSADTGSFDTGSLDSGSMDAGATDLGDAGGGYDMGADGSDAGAPHGPSHGDPASAHSGSGGPSGALAGLHVKSYLNPMAVAGFLLGFGGIGVLARSQGAGAALSVGVGLLGGYGMWLTAYLLVTRLFARSGGTSHYRQSEIVGIAGVVTAPVGAGSPGMVSYTIAGTRQSVRALVDDCDDEIPVGAPVRIHRIEHGTAHVSREEVYLSAPHR